MLSFSKRFFYVLFKKLRRKKPDKSLEEKWIIDLSKPDKSPFDIKSESTYNSYRSNGSLVLGLRKPNCIAWVDIPEHEYSDHTVEAKIRLDNLGGYASAGLLFHIADKDTFCMALVSSKGYFRFDVVKDGAPKSVIAWTEVSDFDGTNFSLSVTTYGINLIFLVNGKWVGAISDDSINSGCLGFALASYEAVQDFSEYTCKACLDYLSVDARIKQIEDDYKKWNDGADISSESRLLLAETFAVMGKNSLALEQIKKAWERREEAASGVSANRAETRTDKELLLSARMAFRLEQYQEAENYIDALLAQETDTVDKKEAIVEKARILNELNKFAELKDFILKHSSFIGNDIEIYALLARCYMKLNEYENSAAAWKKAYELDAENGVYAVKAANALELAGKKEEALVLFLQAGKNFMQQNNQAELAALIPKLVLLGEKNWEARALAGKCAFGIEDYERCEAEFIIADKLRCALNPRPEADSALSYLWGLVLYLKGKNSEAIRRLEQAVKLSPDYGLFRFKLAEVKLASGKRGEKYAKELRLALDSMGDDPEGKMAHYAGTLLLNTGDNKNAEYFFERAGIKSD
jgi:tetratricopeptide (TPR) repeat protein